MFAYALFPQLEKIGKSIRFDEMHGIHVKRAPKYASTVIIWVDSGNK